LFNNSKNRNFVLVFLMIFSLTVFFIFSSEIFDPFIYIITYIFILLYLSGTIFFEAKTKFLMIYN